MYASTRVVFDRKHVATRTKTGLVQVEVSFNGARRWVGTGVKVCANEWLDGACVVNRMDAMMLNERISGTKKKIDEYINECADGFSLASFSAWWSDAKQDTTFPEWVAQRIEARGDIADSTKKTQRKLVGALKAFGRIVSFKDLNRANVVAFDDWLHGQGIKQTTVWSYHKFLKIYVHDAIRRELIPQDPYLGFKADRGKSEWGRFLSPEEVSLIEQVDLPTESLRRVRALFLLQCYTGLAYSDLMSADFRRHEVVSGVKILTGDRRKTSEQYTTVLSDKACRLLDALGWNIPAISNAKYNVYLKILANAAGIDKPIASHYGRRTCGMLLLNDGYPIEVVAKVLGHANIKTTQEAYARIIDKTVAREFAKRQTKEAVPEISPSSRHSI